MVTIASNFVLISRDGQTPSGSHNSWVAEVKVISDRKFVTCDKRNTSFNNWIKRDYSMVDLLIQQAYAKSADPCALESACPGGRRSRNTSSWDTSSWDTSVCKRRDVGPGARRQRIASYRTLNGLQECLRIHLRNEKVSELMAAADVEDDPLREEGEEVASQGSGRRKRSRQESGAFLKPCLHILCVPPQSLRSSPDV